VRVIGLNADALRPAPYVGVPTTRSGGQTTAQVPAQVLVPGCISYEYVYSVKPALLTNTLPSVVAPTATVAWPEDEPGAVAVGIVDDDTAVVELDAAAPRPVVVAVDDVSVDVDFELPVEHAVNAAATDAATPIRRNMRGRI